MFMLACLLPPSSNPNPQNLLRFSTYILTRIWADISSTTPNSLTHIFYVLCAVLFGGLRSQVLTYKNYLLDILFRLHQKIR
jgi:hypothetical protein